MHVLWTYVYYTHIYIYHTYMYIMHISRVCVCARTLRYASVNTSTLRLIATAPQKETKQTANSFSPSFPWSIRKESGVSE